LAGLPLDSERPSGPSLALGIVRVLRESDSDLVCPRLLATSARDSKRLSGPSLALGIVRVLRKGGYLILLGPKSQVPVRAVQGPVPVVDQASFRSLAGSGHCQGPA